MQRQSAADSFNCVDAKLSNWLISIGKPRELYRNIKFTAGSSDKWFS